MKEALLNIINNYGVMNQLEYWHTEVFELNEAIIKYEDYYYENYDDGIGKVEWGKWRSHIAEEIADNYVMLYQFPEYYYERLEYHDIAPYEFKTDNYENIDDISKYLKKFQKDVCKLTCEIAIAEERDQDYISEYRYEIITEKIDDVIYKLKSIQLYYKISDKEIKEVMRYKINRQLERISKGE